MTPFLGQEVTPTTDVDLEGVTYLIARLSPDGSRRVIERYTARISNTNLTWAAVRDFWIDRWEGDPIVFWGIDIQVISNALRTAGREGWYLPYPPADGIAIVPVPDPVNHAVQFFAWREHLASIAHELADHHFERRAVRSHTLRAHSARPANLTDEDAIRNSNMTQWGREELGRLWHELHAWAKLDEVTGEPTVDWGTGTEFVELKAKIEGFCAACEGRGRIALIHDEHAHLLWETALRDGKRFLPDFNTDPFGVFELGPPGTMNGATYTADIHNFRAADRFYSVSHADKVVDRWPDALDSIVTPQLEPLSVSVPPGDYESERQTMARYFATQFFVLSHDPTASEAHMRTFRRHCAMNLLAVLRPENWEHQGIIDRFVDARVTANEYMRMTPNQIHQYWNDHADETTWRRGYIRYYHGAAVYVRDARPLDPTNDPTTASESTSFAGDNRVSTHAHVILESEIDRSNSRLRGPDQPWTAEAEWVARLDALLGEP